MTKWTYEEVRELYKRAETAEARAKAAEEVEMNVRELMEVTFEIKDLRAEIQGAGVALPSGAEDEEVQR